MEHLPGSANTAAPSQYGTAGGGKRSSGARMTESLRTRDRDRPPILDVAAVAEYTGMIHVFLGK